MTPDLYQKYDSFVAIRHQGPLGQDVMERVRRCHDGIASMQLPDRVKAVIRRACEDVLASPEARTEPAAWTLERYVIEEMARLTDQELPRYLFYRYRYETHPQRNILDEFPPCLQIEPASICNYRCVFCYQTDKAFTKPQNGHMGFMLPALFRQVVDQAEGHCEAVTLASRGEPLLCPDIIAMLAYLRGKFLALKLNTNASSLTEEKCHAILQAEVSTVVFSADAAAEPAYSRLRVGGRLARVIDNVRKFHDIRAKQYPRSRTITRVSGVQVPGAGDLDDMERLWGGLVDQVAFVKYNPWENTYERPLNDVATPCSDLWRRMFVWWDGTVNPCDVDYRSMLAVGNATQERLDDIWTGERYAALRSAHLNRQRRQASPCNRCTVV